MVHDHLRVDIHYLRGRESGSRRMRNEYPQMLYGRLFVRAH